MASARARIRNQENENVTMVHGKTSRTPGLKSKGGLETPRRALGDVGNIFKTPGAMKPSLAKSAQRQTLKSSSISNRNRAPSLNVDTKKEKRSSSLQRESSYEKENMIPYIDDDKPLPRSQAVNTILRNVSQLYRGCLHPSLSKPIPYLDNQPKIDVKLENLERPQDNTDPFCWLLSDDSKFFEPSSEISLDDMQLPPVDTDLSGLGLP